MQTVLVTGANGFVGYYIVKGLLRQNYLVVASGSTEQHTKHSHPNFRYQPLDFTKADAVATAFSKWKPEIVIHSGAMSKPDDCQLNKSIAYLTNVEGTKHLLHQTSLMGSQFIFLSTDFVFDGERGLYKEEDDRNPVNYYGETKVLAEDEVMKYPAAWSIVRTILVYGKSAGTKKSFLESVVGSVTENKPLRIFNDQVRMPTFVEDLANGIVSICNKKAKGLYHLSGKDVMTVYEAACKAAELMNLDTSLISPIQEGDLQAPALRPKRTGFDISKAQKELGYEPVGFITGLQKTFATNE